MRSFDTIGIVPLLREFAHTHIFEDAYVTSVMNSLANIAKHGGCISSFGTDDVLSLLHQVANPSETNFGTWCRYHAYRCLVYLCPLGMSISFLDFDVSDIVLESSLDIEFSVKKYLICFQPFIFFFLFDAFLALFERAVRKTSYCCSCFVFTLTFVLFFYFFRCCL